MKQIQAKILIFNVNWLGDVLFSTAAIRNIRYNYPDSYIACIIPPRCLPVLEGNPYINEIIIFDEKKKHRNILAKIWFVLQLRRKRFNKVFLLHRSFSRALITYLAGIPERIGHYRKKRALLLTTKINPPLIEHTHRINYYLNIIEQYGLTVKDRHTDFFISASDEKFADDFLINNNLNKDGLLIGLNPGGNWGPKRWPKENFSFLADRLINELKAQIVITGGYEDQDLADWIASRMENKPVILSGKLNLKQFAALCKRLKFFITADSGPLHIASAIGAKNIIALFGPTDPKLTGPNPSINLKIIQKNVSCKIPCYVVNCPNNRCMKAITVDDVFRMVSQNVKSG